MKIAGLLCTKNYSDDCSVFETLKELTDFVIVLDNNSDVEFPFADQCDEYIALNCKEWEDFGNRITLLYRAFVNQCEWCVSLDDDLIPGDSFSIRKDVVDVIGQLGRDNAEVALFGMKALCEKPGGVYHRYTEGGKGSLFSVVQKNPFYKKNITMLDPQKHRLHRRADCYPHSPYGVYRDHTVYHVGSSTPEKRQSRYDKYVYDLDKEFIFQDTYDHIISDENKIIDLINEDDRNKIAAKWSYISER